MTINFFLKEPKKATETALYITVSVNSKRLKRSVGVKVKPSHWTGTKVKPLAANSASKNLKIENAVNTLKDIEREYLLRSEPLSKEILEREFDRRVNPLAELAEKSFLDVFTEFIQVKKPISSINTIKTFNTCKKHLQSFAEEEGVELSFESVDLRFYDNLLAFFIEKGFLNSTIGKYIKLLKTFMNWAHERAYHQITDYKKFYVFKDDSEKVKLNSEIIETLRTNDFGNESQNIVRDIFILSCYTGLRFADIEGLKAENVNDSFIRIHIKKTREIQEIPLMEIPKQIITKLIETYGYIKVPTNQFCNREIKKMFEKIGFNDVIQLTKHSGSNNITIEKNACDFLTMHYGRIFFITNSLLNGMNEEVIRGITGHKDYKSFKKYVQFSKEMIAERLIEAWTA